MLGCWNLQYFRTAQLYVKSIFNCFDIFGISEQSLFQEQLDLIKEATGNTYNCHAASAFDNPAVVSGEIAPGGVALLWKYVINDFITPLETINSDRIVGIKCDFPTCSPLFILSVYLPSLNDKIEVFNEYFDHLWALYDTLSTDGYVIVLGGFHGNIGENEPNQRGLKLTEFANFFNLSPVNLLKSCIGPVETYSSHCGRYRSNLDYIFLPNCLLDNTLMVKTFDLEFDNTSDHVPIQLNVSYSSRLLNEQDNQSTDSHGFKQKVYWSRFSQEEINGKFVAPLLTSLASVDHGDLNDISRSTDKITKLIVDCSLPLVTPRVNRRRHGKLAIYAKLPDDVKAARFCSKNAFDSWKRDEFSSSGAVHDNYRSKRRDYRKLLRKFLNKLETDKIKKLCVAAESNEKLFWKLLKGQRSTTQMNAYLIDGKSITDKNDIRDMWANHSEDLGKPSVSPCFDYEFSDRVASRVRNIFASCQNELPGTLNEPLQYQEVFNVCLKLKSGVSGVLIDYEHIRFGGPVLWKLLHDFYQVFLY